jgi:flagellar biosynthesis protein FliR
VAFRLAGLSVAAPLLASVVIPMRHKVLIAMMLAAATYPVVLTRVQAPAVVDLPGLVPLVVGEALIGLVMGLIAATPIVSMEMAGVVAGQTMGFGLARAYNPEVDTDADVLGQLLMYIASGTFVAIGGLEALFGGVLRSFERIPLGGMQAPPLDLVVGSVASGLELALRVAMPVTGICLLMILAMGVIGKAMPAFNVLTVGFIVKVIVGLLILALSLPAVGEALAEHIHAAADHAVRWASPE